MTKHKLQEILNDLRIQTSGLTSEAININCPHDHSTGGKSGQPDTKFRCGIWISTLRYHCLRCKRTGSLFSLLQKITRITSAEFKRLIGLSVAPSEESLSDTVRQRLSGTVEVIKPDKEVILPFANPVSLSANQPLALSNWLNTRDISLETCVEYGCLYSGNIGPDAFRLIVPLYDDYGELVAWQGRDVTGRKSNKYKTQGYITDHLFWTTKIQQPRRIYLVEGILDCCRMSYNSVACFSHSLSKRQRTLLMQEKLIDELVICWDGDSYELALKEARQLAPILKRVGVVRLPDEHDPDSLGGDAVRKLAVRWI